MKVLMINSNRSTSPLPIIPIGMAWVCSTLEQAQHKVKAVDLCFSTNPRKKVRKAINNFNPDVIGISIRNIDDSNDVFFLDDIKELIIDVCKSCFKGPIVIGGASVGISAHEMLDFFDLEYAIRGDGEISMVEFVNKVAQNKPINKIKGLVVRKDNKIIEENKLRFENNFDTLPHPNAYKYINVKQYIHRQTNYQIQTKRGCALNCTYCVYSNLEGKKYRYRDPQDIADEIEYVHKKTGIKVFEFIDSAFNIPRDHAKKTLRAILDKKLNIKLKSSEFNPGGFDEEFIDLLIQAKVKEIGITVESGSDTILKDLGKNYNRQTVIEVSEMLRNKNFIIHWMFMLGAPKESHKTINETFDLIRQIVPWNQMVMISSGIRVYKGSKIALDLEKKNKIITNDDYLRPVLMKPENITVEEIYKKTKNWMYKTPNIVVIDKSFGKVSFIFILTVIFYIISNILLIKKDFHTIYIVLRYIEKYTGISYLKASLQKLKKVPSTQ